MDILFNKQRIFDYLDGKATPLEEKQLEQWIKEPENEERFYGWLHEWEYVRLQYRVKEDEGVRKYRNFLYRDSGQAVNTRAVNALPEVASRFASFGRRANWWGVAASFLLLVIGAFVAREKILTVTYQTTYGETRSLGLADGSSVVLTANTTLKVPRFGFGKRSREVVLVGEAMFSVVHTDDDRKFVVKTQNEAEVVVLGTEFSVFARSRGTRVKLNKGKVQVRYQDGDKGSSQVMLDPGEQVSLTANGEIRKEEMPEIETVSSWVVRQFRFEKTPLSEIVQMLSESYDLTVVLENPEMGGLSLSGTYEAGQAEELLSIVAEVLDLEVKKHQNKYRLVFKPE